ncbi:MAG: response regulator transcription factor [Chloroflexi bacterium]|nr:response regulator transcription factor [Chloroflexota bacterium]
MPNSLFDLSKLAKSDNAIHTGIGGARIVWLRQRNRMDDKGQELYRHMQNQGLSLTVTDVFDVSSAELLRADLVLLDAFDSVEGSIETVVARIRFESKVPLVMLTDGYSTEQLVTALTAGADAIWSLNTSVEVLLVRCNALLRRWLPANR